MLSVIQQKKPFSTQFAAEAISIGLHWAEYFYGLHLAITTDTVPRCAISLASAYIRAPTPPLPGTTHQTTQTPADLPYIRLREATMPENPEGGG